MFIREVIKQRSDKSGAFYQYNLVQTARVDGKVKQRVILYLGAEELMKNKDNRNFVLEYLKAEIFGLPSLFLANIPTEVEKLAKAYFEKYCIKFGQNATNLPVVSIPPAPKVAEFHNVDIKSFDISDVKSFGAENLCKQILDKLGLPEYFISLGMNHDQATKSLISIAAKAIFSSSEFKTSQILQMNSELAACYKYDKAITHKHLYAIADLLYSHKELIDKYLYNKIQGMFSLQDKLVILDISNTYFETRKDNSKLAKRGRSKEKRSDCPLVVFTGVINAQGFIRHSRIYEGNKADTATLPDMLADLKKYSPLNTSKTIVIDAGIATEENLEMITKEKYKYVCVARKRIKDYSLPNDGVKVTQLTDRESNKVELSIFKPEGFSDTWMYVESEQKRVKEQSMDSKLKLAYEEDLNTIKKALSIKSGTKKSEKVWVRIGRAMQKHKRVAAQYDIQVVSEIGIAKEITWTLKADNTVKTDKENGVYFIRTNYENPTEQELWSVYNTIREVESTFRCLKSDLNIRPVHHQIDSRIESHIYLTILAYQLVNTIRYMLKTASMNLDWSNIKRIMATQTIQTIELPTDKKQIHIRKASKPIMEVQQIYNATNTSPNLTAIKKYVVYH